MDLEHRMWAYFEGCGTHMPKPMREHIEETRINWENYRARMDDLTEIYGTGIYREMNL